LALAAGLPAQALDLMFPGEAVLVATSSEDLGQLPIATGPWTASGIPTRMAEGAVRQFTWQVTGAELSTMTLRATLEEQLGEEGFEITFACAAAVCGGFDFRHGLPLGDAPEMHVDLGDFQYIAATAASDEGDRHVALTISRGGATGFVHLALVEPAAADLPPVVQASRTPDLSAEEPAPETPEADDGDLIGRLVALGSVALDDLQFQTGASDLTGDGYASLDALAAFLAEDPDRRVVLVGHTDFMGSLAGNIALSEARAISVRNHLTRNLGVRPAQVEARGIGYLAPRAANTTPEGREANRRVEVVLANPG
jgi:OOP family OmpA-OmpF porin